MALTYFSSECRWGRQIMYLRYISGAFCRGRQPHVRNAQPVQEYRLHLRVLQQRRSKVLRPPR